MTVRQVRLFVSSPGDVLDERRRVDLTVERINTEFSGRVEIESIRWETGHYSAHETFQPQIPEAADCDIVVSLFRGRLGSPMPDDFPKKQPSGEPFPSGTAYEVLSAIAARRSGEPRPDIYVFRYAHRPTITLDSDENFEVEEQWKRLKAFFDTWFKTPDGRFIAAFECYDSTDDFAVRLDDCLRQWLATEGIVAQGSVWDRLVSGSPFPGLAVFEANRQSVFFGRSLAIQQAIERLREAGADPKRLPFLLIIGSSGSGKSSLLRAGLIPRLALPGTIPETDLWRVAILIPTADPFAALATALSSRDVLGEELRGGALADPALLAKQLAGDVAIASAPLRDALVKAAGSRQVAAKYETARPARLVLAIDQAERLFAEVPPERAEAFARLLLALTSERLAYVVVVLRGDAYALLQSSPALLELRDRGATYDLTPPGLDELDEIIRLPVAACTPPLAFEVRDGMSLATQLVSEAKRGDVLPLLQVTLARLYGEEEKRGDGLLRFDDYHGLDAAVSETADAAMAGLSDDAKAELPKLVAGLVSDVGIDPVKGAIAPSVVPLDRERFEARVPARRSLLNAFIEARLLTSEGDDEGARVRPVHDSLLRIWPHAAEIVKENASLIRVRRTLEPIVREWRNAPKNELGRHLEISPALLDGSKQLEERFGNDLDPEMRAFIVAAEKAHESRVYAQSRRQKTLLVASIAALFVFATLAVCATFFWFKADEQRQAAESARQRQQLALTAALQAESRTLARQARDYVDRGQLRAALATALEALPKDLAAPERPLVHEAITALGYGVLYANQFRMLHVGKSAIVNMTVSPDEKWVLAAAADGSTEIVSLEPSAFGNTIAHLPKSIILSGVDPNAKVVAAATNDNELEVWAPSNWTSPIASVDLGMRSTWLAVDPTGSWIGVGGSDGSVRLLNSKDGKPAAEVGRHAETVTAGVFDGSGQILVTAAQDGSVRIWDIASNHLLQQITVSASPIWDVALDHNAHLVATASADGIIRLWDLRSGKPVRELSRQGGEVIRVVFAETSDRLFSTYKEGDAVVWDPTNGAILSLLMSASGSSESIALNRTGTLVALGSSDGTVQIFDGVSSIVRGVLKQHTGAAHFISFSGASDRLISAGVDGKIIAWNFNRPAYELVGDGLGPQLAAFDPNGAILSLASNGTLRSIDPGNGAILSTASLTGSPFASIAYPDCANGPVTASLNGTLNFWNLHDLTKSRTFYLGGVSDNLFMDSNCRTLVAVLSDGDIRTISLPDGVSSEFFAGRGGTVSAAAFRSDDSLLALAGTDGRLTLWNLNSGTIVDNAMAHTDRIAGVAFAKDHLISGAWDGELKSWSLPNLTLDETVRVGNSAISAMMVDAHANTAVIGCSDGAVSLWFLSPFRLVKTWRAHGQQVSSIDYDASNVLVLTGSLDGTSALWDGLSGELLNIMDTQSGAAVIAKFGREYRWILTNAGGNIQSWPALGPLPESISKARQTLRDYDYASTAKD